MLSAAKSFLYPCFLVGLIGLIGLSSLAAADSLDREVCYCQGWNAHLENWRHGYTTLLKYQSNQLNKALAWGGVCDEPKDRATDSDFKFKKHHVCQSDRATCAQVEGRNICFDPEDRKISIDGESYEIGENLREVEINLDCTESCRYHHGPQSADPWENVFSVCNRTTSRGVVERAFKCETHHYPHLKEYKWPVGSF